VIALDTNIVVRILTGDDPDQFTIASERVADEDLWLCKTVVLESEWVLRYTYRFSREGIYEGLRRLLGYERLQLEDRDSVLNALAWYSRGMDFADALHLSSSAGADRFITFDRNLAEAAEALGKAPAVELLPSKRL
jgi:predicted nucleic-acid-binding protein